MNRRDKENYYLDIAEVVLERCTCIRRHYGAIIVKNDEVISTGYVGAPRGRANCNDIGYCYREKNRPSQSARERYAQADKKPCREDSAMSCAVPFMRKPTPLSVRRATR